MLPDDIERRMISAVQVIQAIGGIALAAIALMTIRLIWIYATQVLTP